MQQFSTNLLSSLKQNRKQNIPATFLHEQQISTKRNQRM